MRHVCLAFLAAAYWLVACAGPVTPTPTPTPTPDELLDRAGQAVLAMASAQFVLAREGTPAVLDPATGTTFTEVTGQYQAPDRVSAKVRITLFGSVVELQMLWLPEGDFVTNPLTQAWAQAPADSRFNGAALFTTDGIAGVLQEGVTNVALVGVETVEEQETYHLKGDADGARLSPLTAGTLAAGSLYPLDVWMETASSNLVRLHIAEPDGSGWLIDVFAVNEPVEIKAP